MGFELVFRWKCLVEIGITVWKYFVWFSRERKKQRKPNYNVFYVAKHSVMTISLVKLTNKDVSEINQFPDKYHLKRI